MRWTEERKAEARSLHAKGWTDRQMADHFGIRRNGMATYRAKILGLPINREKLKGETETCSMCGLVMQQGQNVRHVKRRHGISAKTATRPKKVTTIRPLLYPRAGNLDTAALVMRILEVGRAA